jgi:hypothetical protein
MTRSLPEWKRMHWNTIGTVSLITMSGDEDSGLHQHQHDGYSDHPQIRSDP